jgi:hypothetical protein
MQNFSIQNIRIQEFISWSNCKRHRRKGDSTRVNEPFEKGRNTELGEMFPAYAPFMSALNDRIRDLMTPFSQDWYMDKNFLEVPRSKKYCRFLSLSFRTKHSISKKVKRHLESGKSWYLMVHMRRIKKK